MGLKGPIFIVFKKRKAVKLIYKLFRKGGCYFSFSKDILINYNYDCLKNSY
ncbi:hypothetical protein CHRY9293_02650 [Chryseobacterium potabilaquae]|uniref:Uncharacterized protein n=1 Tax=Chryseobacterium potabilaquae TaxID=2675057 RepID=A0A6N4XAG1_9FLAO|nr:hypothetical protein CHRY9293_02650 [Chryseobacterium potabilaquae]